MKIGFAQIDATVGDISGNCERILRAYHALDAAGADIVLTPELAICGYPPQDLLFKSRFVPENLSALDGLEKELRSAVLVVGFLDQNRAAQGRHFHNAAAVLEPGTAARFVHKTLLPTYDVFDEARYFEPATQIAPVLIKGRSFGVTICEDIWPHTHLPRPLYASDPLERLAAAGATAILNLSASPFQMGKPADRLEMITELAIRHGLPIHYCNAVGGNDQLVFDGNSLSVNASGKPIWQGAAFAEETGLVDEEAPALSALKNRAPMQDLQEALTLGLRDYMGKCGFASCVLGLSGGIDSAVTAAIAVAAVGAENVTGVAMPSDYSSQHSVDDALALAENLGIRCLTVPIRSSFAAFKDQMRDAFAGREEDLTEENMQARLRGLTLMSLSNKFGHLLLTTGNKSELAVGYCTLYGDMCGGLAVISDVPKVMVYQLARHINASTELIPTRTIEKPPSAELRPDQTDQDTLPPYELLDRILALYVEENLSGPDIIAQGFEPETVRWILRKVDLNEYKRAQAAPGLKVTGRAFGMGRRMPIAQKFVP
jgi:NAD+ synthase (glutamine-hydrolysing)